MSAWGHKRTFAVHWPCPLYPRKQTLQSRFDNSAKYAWKFKAGTVADAVAFESVSTAEFPANREKNREFFNFGPDSGLEHPMRPMISRALEQIPYVTEQGILPQEQGIFSVKSEITPRMRFSVHTGR